MRRLIIGAPFGNCLSWPGATSTVGTYTLKRRAGTLGRIWRVLRTVRYWGKAGGWVNRLGLPSPGVAALEGTDLSDRILSVHGFDFQEWYALVRAAVVLRPLALELNLSCPNVRDRSTDIVRAVDPAVQIALNEGLRVIVKLPPVRWMDLAVPLHDLGVRHFHCCNTIPVPGGGLSGKAVKQYSLWALADLRQKWGEEVTLIGGGGVTGVADLEDYLAAGADHVAVASMLLNPFNWRRVRGMVEWLESSPRPLLGHTGAAAAGGA